MTFKFWLCVPSSQDADGYLQVVLEIKKLNGCDSHERID